MAISTLLQRFACARLSRPCLPGSSSRLLRDAHHHGFWPKRLAVAWDQRPDRRTRRALLHLQYSCAAPCGPTMLVTQGTSLPRLAASIDNAPVLTQAAPRGIVEGGGDRPLLQPVVVRLLRKLRIDRLVLAGAHRHQL